MRQVIDEVGEEFWVTIERAYTSQDANPASRKIPPPLSSLEGYRKVGVNSSAQVCRACRMRACRMQACRMQACRVYGANLCTKPSGYV